MSHVWERYLCDAAQHLRCVTDEWEWDIQTGLMLREMLLAYEIVFADGFVLNGDDHLTMLGRDDACKIIGMVAKSPLPNDWRWWHLETGRTLSWPEGFAHAIMGRIAKHPTVAAVPGWPPP